MNDQAAAKVRGVARVEGHHWVSEFNFLNEVTSQFDFPKPLALIDSTIRKVVYTAGVRPTIADILRIGKILEEIGVRDESLNVWWWDEAEPNEAEFEVLKAVAGAGFTFHVSAFADTLVGDGGKQARPMRSSVDLLARTGVRILSPGLLQAADADAERRQIDELTQFADYARQFGLSWTVTIANCGRRNFDQLVTITNAAIELGAERLDLMDSTSALSPEAMKLFLRTYRGRLVKPTPITMHTHDDFGMATAGTVAAATVGASPDVSLNGVSYRSGFAALEEVVLALEVLYGVDTRIQLDRLQWAANELARVMDLPIPPLKPVVGAHQFIRDSPGEIANLLRAGLQTFPQSGQSVDPSVTGSRMTWVWGKQSSPILLHALADSLGLKLSDAEEKAVRIELNRRLAEIAAFPKWIAAEEVEATLRRTVERQRNGARQRQRAAS